MSKRRPANFPTVKDLAEYIEKGGAALNKVTRQVFYSLRELPPNTEQLLYEGILKPYTEAEMNRDYRKHQLEKEQKTHKKSDLEMEELFENKS